MRAHGTFAIAYHTYRVQLLLLVHSVLATHSGNFIMPCQEGTCICVEQLTCALAWALPRKAALTPRAWRALTCIHAPEPDILQRILVIFEALYSLLSLWWTWNSAQLACLWDGIALPTEYGPYDPLYLINPQHLPYGQHMKFLYSYICCLYICDNLLVTIIYSNVKPGSCARGTNTAVEQKDRPASRPVSSTFSFLQTLPGPASS